MRDRHLDATMAWRAEGNEICHFVRYIDDQEIAATVDMVDIKSTPARAAFHAAQPTNLIAIDDLFADTLPSGAVFQTLPAAIIRMARAGQRSVRAVLRAVATTAPDIVGERAVGLAALRTNHRLSGDESCIAAAPRTRQNRCILRVKVFATANALPPSCLSFLEGSVASLRAKAAFSWTLYHMVRAIKRLVTLCTDVTRPSDHRCAMACLRAKDGFAVIRLEVALALGARLEHG